MFELDGSDDEEEEEAAEEDAAAQSGGDGEDGDGTNAAGEEVSVSRTLAAQQAAAGESTPASARATAINAAGGKGGSGSNSGHRRRRTATLDPPAVESSEGGEAPELSAIEMQTNVSTTAADISALDAANQADRSAADAIAAAAAQAVSSPARSNASDTDASSAAIGLPGPLGPGDDDELKPPPSAVAAPPPVRVAPPSPVLVAATAPPTATPAPAPVTATAAPAIAIAPAPVVSGADIKEAERKEFPLTVSMSVPVFYKVRHRDESKLNPYSFNAIDVRSAKDGEELTVEHLKRAIRKQENWYGAGSNSGTGSGGSSASSELVQLSDISVEKLSEEEMSTTTLASTESLSTALRGTNAHNFLWISVRLPGAAAGAAGSSGAATTGPAAAPPAAMSASVQYVIDQASLKASGGGAGGAGGDVPETAAEPAEKERVGVELQTLVRLWRQFKNLMASHSIKITMFTLFYVAIARPNPLNGLYLMYSLGYLMLFMNGGGESVLLVFAQLHVAAQYLYQLISVSESDERIVRWVGLYRPLYILDDAGVVVVVCLQLLSQKWNRKRIRDKKRAEREAAIAAREAAATGVDTSTSSKHQAVDSDRDALRDADARVVAAATVAATSTPDNVLDNVLSKLYDGNTLEVTYLIILIAAFLRYDLSSTIDVGILGVCMLLNLSAVRRVWRALTWYWVLFFIIQWVFALIPPLTLIIKDYNPPWSEWEDDVQRWLLLKNMGNSWIYQFISLFAAAFQHRVFVSETDAVLQAAANDRLPGAAGAVGPNVHVFASPFADALEALKREEKAAAEAKAAADAKAAAAGGDVKSRRDEKTVEPLTAVGGDTMAVPAMSKPRRSISRASAAGDKTSRRPSVVALSGAAGGAAGAAAGGGGAEAGGINTRSGLAALFRDQELLFIMKVQSLKTYLMGVLIFVFFVGAYEAAVAMNIFSGSYLMLALYLCNSTEIWKAESARTWKLLKLCNFLVLLAKIAFQAPWLANVQAPSYYNSEQILGLQNIRETRIYKYVCVSLCLTVLLICSAVGTNHVLTLCVVFVVYYRISLSSVWLHYSSEYLCWINWEQSSNTNKKLKTIIKSETHRFVSGGHDSYV